MFQLRKLVVFLVTLLFLFYTSGLLYYARKKWGCRIRNVAVLILGVLFLAVATFLDMIPKFDDIIFITKIIEGCFTIGSILLVIGLIFWFHFIIRFFNRLKKLTVTDYLTGLLNRSGIEEVYENLVKVEKTFYLIVCDLNGTKRINDTCGHVEGDKYIISTAKIISDVIGNKGYVSRTGGDEFIILLKCKDSRELENIITSIKEKVCEIFPQVNTGISMGSGIYNKDGISFKELMKTADMRMYEDKRENANRHK